MAGPVGISLAKSIEQKLPVDPIRQNHLLVAHMDDLIEPRAEHIALASLDRFLWLHGTLQITAWSRESQMNPPRKLQGNHPQKP